MRSFIPSIIIRQKLTLILGLVLPSSAAWAAGPKIPSPETAIWFAAPARQFTESSPLGNGRLGAMMFGGISEERIVLNENSMWSGSPQEADRPGAAKVLPEIRRLLLIGKNVEAEALVNANFTCNGPGSAGGAYGAYQLLGNLRLHFPSSAGDSGTANYHRELDLGQAVARVNFRQDRTEFHREMFVSAADQVMVLRLTANRAGAVSFDASLERPERSQTVADSSHALLMTGQLDNGTDGKGVRYAARVRAMNSGGEVSTEGNVLHVRQADEVVLLISAATDYQGFAGRRTPEPIRASLDDLNQAAAKSYGKLRAAHLADYQRYFRRASLQLGSLDASISSRPTPERIQALKSGAHDPALAALYFNFGRYLLISSSRPGGLPANLQGLWAEELRTPWNGDWHLDVNVEMNYWPAEICNLSALHQPLFALIHSLQVPGAKTAQAYYGARGWVTHVIANPWGFTSPGESASWGATTSGSAWLCQHLYDHYLYTRDRAFLEWAYPIMKGSARFYADMLIEEPSHRWLVNAPGNSPENHFRMPDGREASICMGPTIDSQLERYLFGACIESSRILGIDEAFRNELVEKRARLAPTRIGSDGRIMEWLEEYGEPEPKHRHASHLWGLYPGNEISPDRTPDLAQAARKSLDVRGDEGLGWSSAFKAALWARLGDGERAWKLVRQALNPVTTQEIKYDNGGGVYPNLFDACPPFQIDGNFGTTAAIAEMLLQSKPGRIQFLPALPEAWSEGKATGLCARGGFEVDLAWKHGQLVSATVRSANRDRVAITYRKQTVYLDLDKGVAIHLDGSLHRN